MKIVRTVYGDIAPGELGHTQCHEHIFIEKDKSAEINPVLCIDNLEKSTQELRRYKQAGGDAIVDAQPVMCGRIAEWQVEASAHAQVHVIASTGFHKTMFYYEDSYIFSDSEEKICDLYISEILQGMRSSRTEGYRTLDAKAGIIKVAVDTAGLYADKTYEKLHTAAAAAQRRTGAAVMCHMEQGSNALEVADFYSKAGVPADRLWLAHLDRAEGDIGIHKELLARGCYLEYDTIAREKYHSDEKERELILALIEAGYEKQLLLGLDTTRARLTSYGGETGLDYILKTFLPYLLAGGVAQAQIQRLMVQNPAAALAIEENILLQK